jgi:hypothetical protein
MWQAAARPLAFAFFSRTRRAQFVGRHPSYTHKTYIYYIEAPSYYYYYYFMCSPRPAPSPIKSVRLYYVFGQPTAILFVYIYSYIYVYTVPMQYLPGIEYTYIYIYTLDARSSVPVSICRLKTIYIIEDNKIYKSNGAL